MVGQREGVQKLFDLVMSRIETKARGEEGYVQGGCGSGSSKGMKWFIIVLPDGELNCGVC